LRFGDAGDPPAPAAFALGDAHQDAAPAVTPSAFGAGGKSGGGARGGGLSAFSDTLASEKPHGLGGFGASAPSVRAKTPPKLVAAARFAPPAAADDEDAGGDGGGEEADAYEVISGDPNAPSQTTMCSVKEFKERWENGKINNFSEMERDPATTEALPELAVCLYQHHRGGAGAAHTGSNMRTLRAMQDTITHLETVWMTSEMLERVPGGYAGIYKVLHDAIKAISADMAFLRRHYAPSLVVANVFERIIRIALDAHYRVAEDLAVDNARPAEWADQWVKDHGILDQMKQKKGIELSRTANGGTYMGSHEDYIYKNLNTLVKDVYPELRSRGIRIPSEAEFAAYYMLKLCMRGGHEKDEQDLYHSLSHDMRCSPEIKAVMALRQVCACTRRHIRRHM